MRKWCVFVHLGGWVHYGSIGKNIADVLCSITLVKSGPRRTRPLLSLGAGGKRIPFSQSQDVSSTGQPCSVLDSLAALAREKSAWPFAEQNGPQNSTRIRTGDLLITNQLHYRCAMLATNT